MGWASGSQLAEGLYSRIRKWLPLECREQVAIDILEEFEGRDADDWDITSDLIQDAKPDWLGEEE